MDFTGLNGTTIRIDKIMSSWEIKCGDKALAHGFWHSEDNHTKIVITDELDDRCATVYDDGEIECDGYDLDFGDDDERGVCLICGATFDWGWENDYDDDLGEIKTRGIYETHYEDEGREGSLVNIIYKLEFENA